MAPWLHAARHPLPVIKNALNLLRCWLRRRIEGEERIGVAICRGGGDSRRRWCESLPLTVVLVSASSPRGGDGLERRGEGEIGPAVAQTQSLGGGVELVVAVASSLGRSVSSGDRLQLHVNHILQALNMREMLGQPLINQGLDQRLLIEHVTQPIDDAGLGQGLVGEGAVELFGEALLVGVHLIGLLDGVHVEVAVAGLGPRGTAIATAAEEAGAEDEGGEKGDVRVGDEEVRACVECKVVDGGEILCLFGLLYKEFEEEDKMVINGSEEEVDALREKMEEERAKDKKPKKGKNGGEVGVVVNGGGEEGVVEVERISRDGRKIFHFFIC
ncbi:hypothetical protein Tsubulata_024769 [Turnera subulata]|uniref:Uncharacterized protein n=1 Tax=Turnera subulata TaxID=218843 RepID=A0A9Q0J6F3_9ROSI|nr:hypothetical protein Tsubulata_024769 [Turnera subulata]